MFRSSFDHFLGEAIPVARLALCGGIVGASSVGLLSHETLALSGVGAVVGALVVMVMKLARVV